MTATVDQIAEASQSLARMAQEGLINVDGKTIMIIDEQSLYNLSSAGRGGLDA